MTSTVNGGILIPQATVYGGGDNVLRNLYAEMIRRDVSIQDIEEAIGKSRRTARDKIKGVTPFTFPEAQKIRRCLFPDVPIDYLFTDDQENDRKDTKQ